MDDEVGVGCFVPKITLKIALPAPSLLPLVLEP